MKINKGHNPHVLGRADTFPDFVFFFEKNESFIFSERCPISTSLNPPSNKQKRRPPQPGKTDSLRRP